jgi:MFS family permease
VSHRTPYVGWLVSEAVSLTGTRVSMIAIPWLVLTTTGSATRTGLVAFAEMGPYVLAKVAGGPLIDRVGARRVSLAADTASAVAVATIPVLHAVGMLHLPVLLALVAVVGMVRGPGDGAKQALIPPLVAHAGIATEHATGLAGAVERLSSSLGAAAAGLLVAVVGAAPALLVDAASFAVSAVVLGATTRGMPRPAPPPRTGYARELQEGWDFLRHDRVLVGIVAMVALTNLLDQAWTAVLVPVWARQTGGGTAVIGLLFGVSAAAALGGSLVAAARAARLPRFATYVVCFLLAGLPRFVVLALGAPLAIVLTVAVVGGFAAGFLNPILGAVVFERIPEPLVGRVSSLNTALCWSLIPFGGLLGGALVGLAGLSPALLAVGAAYFLATMIPAVRPSFRELDRRPVPADPSVPARHAGHLGE